MVLDWFNHHLVIFLFREQLELVYLKLMKKTSLTLLYIGGGLMLLGGIGDQFINELLDVHKQYLGNPEPSALYSRVQSLLLLMLHSLGGGLISAGISILALTHFAVRNGERWAVWTVLLVAFVAQGFNGYGMYAAGSHYWYPLVLLCIITLGVIMTLVRKD